MKETWKSPRKIEEEVNQYHRDRFEWYMQRVDAEEFTLEVALSALRKEIQGEVSLEPSQ